MTMTRSDAGPGTARCPTAFAARSSTTTPRGCSAMTELRLARLPRAQAALLRLAATLAPAETVLVGGAVRDAVLGRPPVDVDLALPAGAIELARRCADRLGGAPVGRD